MKAPKAAATSCMPSAAHLCSELESYALHYQAHISLAQRGQAAHRVQIPGATQRSANANHVHSRGPVWLQHTAAGRHRVACEFDMLLASQCP